MESNQDLKVAGQPVPPAGPIRDPERGRQCARVVKAPAPAANAMPAGTTHACIHEKEGSVMSVVWGEHPGPGTAPRVDKEDEI
jgi:hypothetical protein